MEQDYKPYQFLYNNYPWPEPGTERDCPYSGVPLQLNKPHPGYNGKPWTCPKCIHYFSQEDLDNPGQYKGLDCDYTLKEKAEQSATGPGE